MRTYQHMNACPLDGKKYAKIINNPDYLCQEKLQGIRVFAKYREGEVQLWTRGGKRVPVAAFPHMKWEHSEDFVIDGELFCRGIADEVIAGWANPNGVNHLDDTSMVRFYAFDIVEHASELLTKMPLVKRLERLSSITLPSWATIVPVYDLCDRETLFEAVVSVGGEGIMLKDKLGIYAEGKRPQNNWFKLKAVDTFDVVVIDLIEGRGKFEGTLGAIAYGMYLGTELMLLGCVSGFTDYERNTIWAEPQAFKGRVMEVKASCQDARSGALIEPRFLRWRNDKKPLECVWNS